MAKRTPKLDINAEDVKDACLYNRSINDHLREIFGTIQHDIRENSKHGVSKIRIPIPTNFNIAGMTNRTAQTVIYHAVINELTNKGFEVSLSVSLDIVIFNIGWQVKNSNSELIHMREVIAKHIA